MHEVSAIKPYQILIHGFDCRQSGSSPHYSKLTVLIEVDEGIWRTKSTNLSKYEENDDDDTNGLNMGKKKRSAGNAPVHPFMPESIIFSSDPSSFTSNI